MSGQTVKNEITSEENEITDSKANADIKNSPDNVSDSHKVSENSASAVSSAKSGEKISGVSGQSSHEHSWIEHKSEKWVSNIVTVPDYETKRIPIGTNFIFAYDGYTTPNIEDAKQHAVDLILEGVPDNYRTETIYDTQTVQTGSHQEDHGHYETYVDYCYCACGARK